MSSGATEHLPFNCTRCFTRTTRRESLGMLQCRYHPHLDGPLTPVPTRNALVVHRTDVGRCKPCSMSYTGTQHLVSSAAHSGCASVDHLEPGINLAHILTQQPYEVLPLAKWKCDTTQYRAASEHEKLIYRKKRGVHGPASALIVTNLSQVVCGETRRRAHMRVHLFSPKARECGVRGGVADAFDAGLLISLEAMYNECATKHGYAMMNESSWTTEVLNANRYIMSSGGKDGDEGYTTLTADEICRTELYADTHRVEEHSTFVPFVVVLRIEPKDVRIEMK